MRRSDAFSRTSQGRINEDVKEYLEKEVGCGEASLINVLSWIQEHAFYYCNEAQQPAPNEAEAVQGSGKFSR